MPGLTTSFRCTTPSRRSFSHTASGVPPEVATFATARLNSAGARSIVMPRWRSTESIAPFRIERPGASRPDSRVCAENATVLVDAGSKVGSAIPKSPFASATIERPSGVWSATLEASAAAASSSTRTPGTGRNSVAMRAPNVMVPVLSSSSVSTSPAASTARPEVAITLKRTSRSMPAMPMADSRPPMVVGIRQTSSAIR